MPAKTPWFPGAAKPVREGVYEADWELPRGSSLDDGVWFNQFKGGKWYCGNATPDTARCDITIDCPPKRWRGLTEETK